MSNFWPNTCPDALINNNLCVNNFMKDENIFHSIIFVSDMNDHL